MKDNDKIIKQKKRLRTFAGFIIVIFGLFLISMAFVFATAVIDSEPESLKNIRYGMISVALTISGTFLIAVVFLKSRRKQG
jgi:TRAP-type C4-dicarboxylate transport system permease small subunit